MPRRLITGPQRTRPLGSRPTGKPIATEPTHPNAGLEVQYRKKLLRLIAEMQASTLYWVRVAYRARPPELHSLVVQDASPARTLIAAIKGLGRRWQRRFDTAAPELARYFATAVAQRSDSVLAGILKRGGFTVQFKTTRAVNDVLAGAIEENVSLIKTIAAQHFAAIEQMTMRSVQTGGNLEQLTDELQKSFGVTRRRASLIARDQNNKATAVITRVRQQEIGITHAVWLHSGGGNEPRPEHVKWSGKIYDVATGMWSAVDQAWVWPGTAINCRCVTKSIVPGYDPV